MGGSTPIWLAGVGVAYPKDPEGVLVLGYVLGEPISEEVVEKIELETQRICSGGLRWYLRCPKCRRRGYKLYLPPDATRFRCRGCHDLTHLSVQDHDSRVDAKRNLPALLDAIERGGESAKGMRRVELAMKAFPRWLQVWPKRPWPGPSDAELRLSMIEPEEIRSASAE